MNSTGAVKFRRAVEIKRMRRLVILRQAMILGGFIVSGIVGRSHVALRGGLANPQIALVGPCTREIVAARQTCSTPLEVFRYMVVAVVRCKRSRSSVLLILPSPFPFFFFFSRKYLHSVLS